jgi:hypothetical protein
MEIELVYSNEVALMWDIIQPLIIIGFLIGITVMVIVSCLRLGWILAPYIFVGAFIVWFLQGAF